MIGNPKKGQRIAAERGVRLDLLRAGQAAEKSEICGDQPGKPRVE